MIKDLKNIYIVQEYDTIEKIAEKYKTNPTKILIENNTTPNMIKKGSVLIINL